MQKTLLETMSPVAQFLLQNLPVKAAPANSPPESAESFIAFSMDSLIESSVALVFSKMLFTVALTLPSLENYREL